MAVPFKAVSVLLPICTFFSCGALFSVFKCLGPLAANLQGPAGNEGRYGEDGIIREASQCLREFSSLDMFNDTIICLAAPPTSVIGFLSTGVQNQNMLDARSGGALRGKAENMFLSLISALSVLMSHLFMLFVTHHSQLSSYLNLLLSA